MARARRRTSQAGRGRRVGEILVTGGDQHGIGRAGGNIVRKFLFGKAFENGEGETQDFAIATNLYEKACYRGHAEACAYASFRIRPDKPDRSYLLADAACKQDNARGCGYLGYNYENGVGATTNLYSARDYYNLGCAKGYSSRDSRSRAHCPVCTPRRQAGRSGRACPA